MAQDFKAVYPPQSAISGYDGEQFYFANVDSEGSLKSRNLIWNSSTLAWEAATGSLGAGGAVTVTNFPAVISGASIPVSSSDYSTRWAEKSDNANIIYVGEASPGTDETTALWKIQEINTTNGTIKWAASAQFNQIWSARESGVYS